MRETVGVKGERFLKGRSAVEFTPANDWLLLILATRTRRCGRADSDIVECDLEGLHVPGEAGDGAGGESRPGWVHRLCSSPMDGEQAGKAHRRLAAPTPATLHGNARAM